MESRQASMAAAAKKLLRKQAAIYDYVNGFNCGESREEMIQETAYHLAEQRGFTGDTCLADWLDAEQEIDTLLNNEEKVCRNGCNGK